MLGLVQQQQQQQDTRCVERRNTMIQPALALGTTERTRAQGWQSSAVVGVMRHVAK